MALRPLAFLAGAISFSSPCCLPLLPGYLAHIGGLVDRERKVLRSRSVLGALLFIAGFASVFTALGASLGLVGGALLSQKLLINYVAGGLIVVNGDAPDHRAATHVLRARTIRAPSEGQYSSDDDNPLGCTPARDSLDHSPLRSVGGASRMA